MKQNERLYTQAEFLARLVQSDSNLLGYFIRERRGILSDAMARRYGMPAVVPDMPEWMVENGRVAADSTEAWRSLFAAADRGEKSGSAMITLKAEGGETFGRYWLRLDTVSDEHGEPFFAIISVDDFTAVSEQVRTKDNDINSLLHATQRVFPEILTLNLTQGTYRMIQYDGATTLDTPRTGRIDDMIRIRLGGVVEEDREVFASMFSRENLEEAFIRAGRESLQLAYRRPGHDGRTYWMESTVMRQHNAFGSDVLLVAMSRSVDAQKAEETRLREQLRIQEEELRVVMSKMGTIITYYDVPGRILTIPSARAAENGLPSVMTDFPESFIDGPQNRLSQDACAAIREFYDAVRRGEPTGSCEYPISSTAGREVWMRLEFASIFDAENRPVRAVVTAENITVDHVRAVENERLKENERILRLIAQHSDRVVTCYDPATQMVRFWNADAENSQLSERPLTAFWEDEFIPPESLEKAERLLKNIHSGVPSGEEKLLIKNEAGKRLWLEVKYSTIRDGSGKPVFALISHKDITEQHEHEVAYLRHANQLAGDAEKHLLFIESDLTADWVEKMGGSLLPQEEQQMECSHADFGRRMLERVFLYENREEASYYFSADNLLRLHAQGERQLRSEWQVRFRDGALHWLDTDITLLTDPYTGHVKAFFRMLDITEDKEAQLAIRRRSERDGMTGLLNRATAEERIRQRIAQRDRPGILVLIDLDDLKSINDTFGHKEGDRAILGVAETLRQHFRESDIIGRIGGDEFIVYLPGASENSDAIAVSITALLRRLASIPIGGNDERRIHCSVGCAVQTAGADTFESLFKQADTALYHVKRSGKNNFAFYAPEMDQEDYQFKAQKLFSLQSTKKFEMDELQHLLGAIADFYQLVLSVNLSTNDYYLMQEARDGVFSEAPTFGVLDDFIEMAAREVHDSDAADFSGRLSRKALLEAYGRGEKSLRHYFRFRSGSDYLWTEAIVIFYTNEQGDVCDFTLLRWAGERAYELERLWLQKVLDLAVVSSFEYVCLLNVESGEYFLYGGGDNTHAVPKKGSFDAVTREVRDRFIAPDEREAYYENAKLSSVDARMREGDGTYSYRYTMPDGPRLASFYWFEPTHTQILMTVQRR